MREIKEEVDEDAERLLREKQNIVAKGWQFQNVGPDVKIIIDTVLDQFYMNNSNSHEDLLIEEVQMKDKFYLVVDSKNMFFINKDKLVLD